MSYAIIRDGKSIELTDEETYEAYRYQNKMFRMQDARYHVDELINDELNKKNLSKLKKLNEADIEILAERFLSKYDCNCDENTLWNSIIGDYIA